VQEYVLPIRYAAGRHYTAAQLGVHLEEQPARLCWFAEQSGYERCALLAMQ